MGAAEALRPTRGQAFPAPSDQPSIPLWPPDDRPGRKARSALRPCTPTARPPAVGYDGGSGGQETECRVSRLP